MGDIAAVEMFVDSAIVDFVVDGIVGCLVDLVIDYFVIDCNYCENEIFGLNGYCFVVVED